MRSRRENVGLLVVLGAFTTACTRVEKEFDQMVFIQGGTFLMGTDKGYPYEGPPHQVTVGSFWIDRYEVTNRQFQKFVQAAGYVTEAEKLGWSGVFLPEKQEWTPVQGASWRHPEGPGSSLTDRMNHPVVHVSWSDARAYAQWAGKRLPAEAEWEWAARGGVEKAEFAWGDELNPGERFMANTWQGFFPLRDEARDGFSTTAPVGSFPPNGYGLYDMAGNVWEWTLDWFSEDYFALSDGAHNPRGPEQGAEKVLRGGSWLCAPNYCTGYRVAARQKTALDSGLNNLGFRCVRPAEERLK